MITVCLEVVYSQLPLPLGLKLSPCCSLFVQDHDRDLMARQESSGDMVPMGDGDGLVELTSIRRLDTVDSIDITSESRASVSSPTAGSDDGNAEKSLAADIAPSSPTDKRGSGNDAEGGGEGEEPRGSEDREEEKSLTKRGSQLAIQKIQRPDSLEIDDSFSPKTTESSCRNPRKSVLRKKDPTPVHTGPTYTSTSPLGDPYDSTGKRRSSTSVGRECCSVM